MELSSLRLPDWIASTVALGEIPDTVLAALVSAVLTLGLASALLGRRPAKAEEEGAREEDAARCEFLVNGASLRPLTPSARELIDGLGGRHAPLQALTRHLEGDCPRIAEDLEGLVLFGAAFRRHCLRADGTAYEIAGEPRGAAARISIRPATPEFRALDEAERALARATDEIAFHRDALDRAPVLAWTAGPDKQVLWANAAYRERFDAPEAAGPVPSRQLDAFAHLLEEVPLTGRSAGETRRRVKVASGRDGEPLWFELSQAPLASGDTLSFAVAVDDLVAAEASLRRFVETLTETFAHLPIGLAVFDKNRRLGLFNPALSDLVKIDAVWLAGRPSLRDFLERLRETRQMPEQRDFAAFRRMLTELEKGARDGTYEENWVLPSGKIFRVTGRPHPQGALAFLFEDISPAIHLERRYRAELELSQATLDRMSEAVAVFDTSGMLVFVNSAFEALWGTDPMEGLDGPSVAELARLWEERCRPSGLWSDLRAFATGADNRTSWTGAATTLDGRDLAVLVAPLPTGSTLVTFRERHQAPALPAPAALPGDGGARRAALLGGLALAELEAPAEAALGALGAAIAGAPSARAVSGLVQAAQGLKDGLARARALQARAPDPVVDGEDAPGLAECLAALLAVHGLELGAAIEHGAAAAGVRHAGAARAEAAALSALAMAVASFAAPGAAVELTVDRGGEVTLLLLQLAAPIAAPEPDCAVLAEARRRLHPLGAELETALDGGGLAIAARLSRSAPVSAPALAAAG